MKHHAFNAQKSTPASAGPLDGHPGRSGLWRDDHAGCRGRGQPVRLSVHCEVHGHLPDDGKPLSVRTDLRTDLGFMAFSGVWANRFLRLLRCGGRHPLGGLQNRETQWRLRLGGWARFGVRALYGLGLVGAVLAFAGCAQPVAIPRDTVTTLHDTRPKVMLPPVIGKQSVEWKSPLAVSCPEGAWVLERPLVQKAPARVEQHQECH